MSKNTKYNYLIYNLLQAYKTEIFDYHAN